MANRWGVGFVVVLIAGFAAGGLAFGSFSDSVVPCGAPVAVAAHGKDAVRADVGDGKTKLIAVPSDPRSLDAMMSELLLRAGGIYVMASHTTNVCRQPARGRLLGSVTIVAAAVLGVAFVTKRSRTAAEPTEPEPVPVSV